MESVTGAVVCPHTVGSNPAAAGDGRRPAQGGVGGVFPFGDATEFGSNGAIWLNERIVGMTATASGNGYSLAESDGGLFPFGGAVGRRSTGAIRLNRSAVGMAGMPDGGGYWLVASDRGIFSFGDALEFGSTDGLTPNNPAIGTAASR